jgi:hypothetical protein
MLPTHSFLLIWNIRIGGCKTDANKIRKVERDLLAFQHYLQQKFESTWERERRRSIAEVNAAKKCISFIIQSELSEQEGRE